MTLYLPFYREGKDRGKLLENVIKYVKFPTLFLLPEFFYVKRKMKFFCMNFCIFKMKLNRGNNLCCIYLSFHLRKYYGKCHHHQSRFHLRPTFAIAFTRFKQEERLNFKSNQILP